MLSVKACSEARAVLVTCMASMVDPKHLGQMGLSSPDRGNLQHGLLYSPWPACEHPMQCPLLQDIELLATQQPSHTASGAASPWQLMELVRHRRFWLTHDSTAHGRPCRSLAQSWPAEPCPARPWQPVLPPRVAVPGPDGLQWPRPGCSLCRVCSGCLLLALSGREPAGRRRTRPWLGLALRERGCELRKAGSGRVV